MINSSLEVDKWMFRALNRQECMLECQLTYERVLFVRRRRLLKFDTFLISPVRLSEKKGY